MHKAPTVDYPVGPSRFYTLALSVIWSGVIGVDAMWLLRASRLDWRHMLGIAVSLAAGVVMALCARRAAPAGTLLWDGQCWWWETGGVRASGEVKPRLDLQSVLLLGFLPHSGARQWLWLEKRTAPTRWNALRRAVHASGQADADVGDGSASPPAEPSHEGGTVQW